MKLVLNGDNTLSSIGTGIYAAGDVSISGTGKVDITADTTGIDAVGDVSISDTGTVDITAGTYGICADGGSVSISGGTVTIKNASIGIYAGGSVTITDGTVNIPAGYYGIEAYGGVSITGGTVKIDATGNNATGIKATGTVTISGTGTVDIKNAYYGIDAVGVSISDTGKVTINAHTGIYAAGAVTITGGTVTITAGATGIYADGTVSISGGTVVAQGGTEAFNKAPDLSQFSNVAVWYGADAGSAVGTQDPPASVYTDSKYVRIAAVVVTPYDLWVGGTQVTSLNANNVFGNGKVTYDATDNILTLNGYDNEGVVHTNDAAIYYGGSDELKLVLEGTNTLSTTGNGIRAAGAVTISGDGTVEIDANTGINAQNGTVTISGGEVTIDATNNTGFVTGIDAASVTISGTGTVTINNAHTGINAPSGSVTITGTGTVTITANTGINANGNVTINGGTVDITTSNEGIRAKGRVSVGSALEIMAPVKGTVSTDGTTIVDSDGGIATKVYIAAPDLVFDTVPSLEMTYDTARSFTVDVMNLSTFDVTVDRVMFSNADHFAYELTDATATIPAGETGSFTMKLAEGVSVGKYTTVIYVYYGTDGKKVAYTTATVTVTPAKEPAPTVTIDFNNETLNFGALGNYTIYDAQRSKIGEFTDVDRIAINADWFGTTVSVATQPRNGNYTESDPVDILIPVRPAAPALTVVQESFLGEDDGALTGLDPARNYEYRVQGTADWTPAKGVEAITGLAPGAYEVRVAAVSGTSFASEITTCTVQSGQVRTYTLECSVSDFDPVTYGYTTAPSALLTLEHIGNSSVTVDGILFFDETGENSTNFTASAQFPFTLNPGDTATVVITPIVGLDAGTHTLRIGVECSAPLQNWVDETGDDLTFTVGRKPLGLVWQNTENRMEGDGKVVTAELTGVLAGDDVSVVVTGGGETAHGTHTATATLAGENASNYQLPENPAAEYFMNHNDTGEPVRENEVPATCKAEGSYDEVLYCAVCKQELSRTKKTIDKLTTHTPGEPVHENEVSATCTAEGSYEEVVYCEVCEEELSRTEVTIDKLAHTPGDAVRENEVPATCTAEGSYEEVVYCEVCGEELIRTEKTIDKLAHTPGDAVRENEVPATCTAEGSYEEVVYCEVCDEELSRTEMTIDKLAHTPGDAVRENEVPATCTAEGSYEEVIYCEVCDEELSRTEKTIDMLAHTPGDAERENEVPATCTAEGSYEEVVYCEVCDEELSRTEMTIDKLAHTEETVPGKAATCTETGLTEGKKCSVCGEILVKQEVIPALGHKDENEDFVCDICGEDLCTEHIEEIIPGKAATCTETGLTEGKKCSVCGEILVEQEVIPALGHKDENEDFVCDICGEDLCTDHIEEIIPGKAATCTETGLTEGKKCTVCDEILIAQKMIPALGHSYDEGIVTTEPTCTEDGVMTCTCQNGCGDSYTKPIPAEGHTDENGDYICDDCGEELCVEHIEEVIPGKEPTLTEPGLTEGKKCAVCGDILLKQEEIPALESIEGTCGENITWVLTKMAF